MTVASFTLPGAVARTSALALNNATLPFVLTLADLIDHAIMHHAIHDIGRVRVDGRTAGFATAALVDGDIDDDRSRPHAAQQSAADQLRRRRTRQKHRADDQVGIRDRGLDRINGREHRRTMERLPPP